MTTEETLLIICIRSNRNSLTDSIFTVIATRLYQIKLTKKVRHSISNKVNIDVDDVIFIVTALEINNKALKFKTCNKNPDLKEHSIPSSDTTFTFFGGLLFKSLYDKYSKYEAPSVYKLTNIIVLSNNGFIPVIAKIEKNKLAAAIPSTLFSAFIL